MPHTSIVEKRRRFFEKFVDYYEKDAILIFE
jgi:hypothetical protein